jgi:glycosyltransferase involved in cell wall biosynthesis
VARSFRASLHARRLLQDLDVDIVHQNNSVGYGEDWFFAARSMKIPLVVHQRGFFFGTSFNRWLTDWSIHRAICISRAVERELLLATRIPSSRVVQIWDFVDTDVFSPLSPADRIAARAAIGEPENRFLIGMIGNVKEWKGQHVVLQALAKLPSETRDKLRCLLFGAVSNRPEDQMYFQRLRTFVRDNRLDSIVAFRGFRGEMTRLYPALDLVVHASIAPEPFGMVLAEAMSCGTPVVASRGGGPDDIVEENETGWLVDRGDAEGLASRLACLVEGRPRLHQIGALARERVVANFSTAAVADKLTALYAELRSRTRFPLADA